MKNVLNWLWDFTGKVEDGLDNPNLIRLLLAFWIAIGCAGLFLIGTNFVKFDWMILGIGLMDLILSIAFGLYYASQYTKARGRHHQKSEEK